MRTLLLLAPLLLAACAVDPGDPRVVDVSADAPDAGVTPADPPGDPPPTATPLFWSSPCLTNTAATQIQLGDVGKPKYIQYTWGGTHTTTASSVVFGVNQYAYDPGCGDGFLVDVYGTDQQFGMVVNYQDTLPTDKDSCLNTSIWVSSYTNGNYLGAYADHLAFDTKWNRYDDHGHPLPIAQQTPMSGDKYFMSSSRYGSWINGKCKIAPLELTFRHPDYPYGPYFPWYRLVIGGFRGTSATTYADKAAIQVKVGLDPGVPGCVPTYYCEYRDVPNGYDDPPASEGNRLSYESLTCADGAKNIGVIDDARCLDPGPPEVSASDVIGLGILILGSLLF